MQSMDSDAIAETSPCGTASSTVEGDWYRVAGVAEGKGSAHRVAQQHGNRRVGRGLGKPSCHVPDLGVARGAAGARAAYSAPLMARR